MTLDFFELLQLNDATFPIGSYTFSWGLETFVQQGIIFNAQSAQEYIKSELYQSFLYNELLTVRLAYENCNDKEKLHYLDEVYGAGKSAFEIREGSKKLAGRFIKTTSSFLAEAEQDNYSAEYLPVAYGSYCAKRNITEDACLSAFIYSQMSARITTAVKLVPLSQTDGQKILFKLLQEFPSVINKCRKLNEGFLCLSAPGIDIRSMQHEYLYSRLYSN